MRESVDLIRGRGAQLPGWSSHWTAWSAASARFRGPGSSPNLSNSCRQHRDPRRSGRVPAGAGRNGTRVATGRPLSDISTELQPMARPSPFPILLALVMLLAVPAEWSGSAQAHVAGAHAERGGADLQMGGREGRDALRPEPFHPSIATRKPRDEQARHDRQAHRRGDTPEQRKAARRASCCAPRKSRSGLAEQRRRDVALMHTYTSARGDRCGARPQPRAAAAGDPRPGAAHEEGAGAAATRRTARPTSSSAPASPCPTTSRRTSTAEKLEVDIMRADWTGTAAQIEAIRTQVRRRQASATSNDRSRTSALERIASLRQLLAAGSRSAGPGWPCPWLAFIACPTR